MLFLLPWWVLTSVASSTVLDPSLHLFPSPPLLQTSASVSPESLWSLARVQRHADAMEVIPLQKVTPYSSIPPSPMALQWYYCQPSFKSSSTTSTPLDTTLLDSTSPTVQETPETTTQRSTEEFVLSPKAMTMSSSIKTPSTTEAEEYMEKAETFWPNLRTQGFGYGNIHVPLTFSISGAYSRYASRDNIGPVGLIGSSYGSISDDGGLYGGGGRSGLAGSSYGSYGTRIYGGNSNAAAWSGWGNGKWGHYGKG